MKNVTLNVQGMTCEGCASTVAAALKRVEGVRRADVLLEDEEAKLLLEDDVREEDLFAAVERAGYGASVRG